MQIQQEGRFRASIVGRSLADSQTSQSAGVRFHFTIYQRFDPVTQEWHDCVGEALEAEGTVWAINKVGESNPTGIAQLVDVLGWDGSDLGDFLDLDKPLPNCEIDVQAENYKDERRYKVNWINLIGGKPQRRQITTREAAAPLIAKYGDKLREAVQAYKRAKQNAEPPPTGEAIPFAFLLACVLLAW